MINNYRTFLSFIFLRFWNFFTNVKIKNIKKNNKKLNVAIIKPFNYLDLYKKSYKSNIKTLINSNYRIGPAGLFTNHNVDFFISNKYDDKDISIKKFSKLKNTQKKEFLIQKKNSCNINNINFDKYDISISFEDTVSKNITQNYRKTLWAKIFEDHRNPDYLTNIFSAKKNFDIVLNQTLGFTPYSFLRCKHWIDFSYTFGNSSFLKKIQLKKKYNIDIVTEVHQSSKIKEKLKKTKLNYVCLDETLNHKAYLKLLSKSKFFLAIDCKKPRWGNSLIEAALCGNLIIANKNHFWNSQLILKETSMNNLDDSLELILKLKKDKKLYNFLVNKQNKLLNYLNYERPLKQIVNFSKQCDRKLNIKTRIN